MDPESFHQMKLRGRLSRLQREALAKERLAWEFLNHAREAGTADDRRRYLAEWTEASRVLREAEARLTRSLMDEAMQDLRDSVGLFNGEITPPPAALPGLAKGPAEQPTAVPLPRQRLRARDGTIWRIDSVARDAFDDGVFLAQVHRETPRGELLDEFEVYSEDWKLVCLAYGLQPLPRSGP